MNEYRRKRGVYERKDRFGIWHRIEFSEIPAGVPIQWDGVSGHVPLAGGQSGSRPVGPNYFDDRRAVEFVLSSYREETNPRIFLVDGLLMSSGPFVHEFVRRFGRGELKLASVYRTVAEILNRAGLRAHRLGHFRRSGPRRLGVAIVPKGL